mmetsp:Transcript_10844/g.19161  ORF Transcript_10844/g.19161 Transcript_10844/m.19161 type:complete len:200 (+) Transcript_10844:369-968(+)
MRWKNVGSRWTRRNIWACRTALRSLRDWRSLSHRRCRCTVTSGSTKSSGVFGVSLLLALSGRFVVSFPRARFRDFCLTASSFFAASSNGHFHRKSSGSNTTQAYGQVFLSSGTARIVPFRLPFLRRNICQSFSSSSIPATGPSSATSFFSSGRYNNTRSPTIGVLGKRCGTVCLTLSMNWSKSRRKVHFSHLHHLALRP